MSWHWFALLIPIYFTGLAVRAIMRGSVESAWQGKTRVFRRSDDPWMFWFLTATLIGISIIILCCGIITVANAPVKP
ncbi:hypothetical protein [Prosthecobacter sp.]|uniref:hypothetical protein n=1 Tax=Prosthecobacter sp. TaxID=1965333 RepID=UPI0037835C19